jgi:hypothetical protein
MTNTQHTPGPWFITQHQAEINHIAIYYEDDSLRSKIADLYDGNLCEEHGTIEANASLIAAAPDLLEALERIMDYAVDGANIRDVNIFEQPQFVNAYAAIAKAKGGAS